MGISVKDAFNNNFTTTMNNERALVLTLKYKKHNHLSQKAQGVFLKYKEYIDKLNSERGYILQYNKVIKFLSKTQIF